MAAESAPVAVVIPLQDEEPTVRALLESLAQQAVSPREIVVVDAGSHDATAAVVAGFDGPFPVRLIRAERVCPGEARNLGAQASTQEWLAFTDGGIEVERTWLARLMAKAASGAEVVFGNYRPVCSSLWTEASAIAYVPVPVAGRGRAPFVASMAIRRSAFDRSGGFPPFRAAEDLVWFERLLAMGLCTAYAPDALVDWQMAATARATYRRFRLYSHHNLAAGRGRYWHHGVARLYVVLAATMAGLAGVVSFQAAVSALPAFFVARALKAAWRARGSLPFDPLVARRVLTAAGVLAVVDAATAAGTLDWLRSPVPARVSRPGP